MLNSEILECIVADVILHTNPKYDINFTPQKMGKYLGYFSLHIQEENNLKIYYEVLYKINENKKITDLVIFSHSKHFVSQPYILTNKQVRALLLRIVKFT